MSFLLKIIDKIFIFAQLHFNGIPNITSLLHLNILFNKKVNY